MSSSGSTAALSPLNSLAFGPRAAGATDAVGSPGTTAAGAPAGAVPDRAQAFSVLASTILGALPAAAAGTSAPSVDPSGVANAIAAALGPTGQGGGGVAALIKSLDGAVVAAGTALKQAGASTESVDNFAADFLRQVSQQLDAIAAQATAPSGNVTSVSTTGTTGSATGVANAAGTAASASLDINERGLIQLQTQDGGVVTIRLRDRTSFSLTGASASGTSGIAAYAQIAAFSSSRFSVSVQGSLNANDLKAINDVLGQVDTLANQFFSGNLAQAFATGSSLSIDPAEIASLKVSLSETESVSVASLGGGAAATSDPSTAPATATPAAAATAAANPAAGSTTPAVAGSSAPAAAGAATAGATASPSALDGLFAYLKAVVAALGTSTVSGTVTISSSTKLALLAGAIGGVTHGRGPVDNLLKQLGAATA